MRFYSKILGQHNFRGVQKISVEKKLDTYAVICTVLVYAVFFIFRIIIIIFEYFNSLFLIEEHATCFKEKLS